MEHQPHCPRAQAWDHGEYQAPCYCDICEHCGAYLSNHDYEHFARFCYPEQLKVLGNVLTEYKKTKIKLLDVLHQVNKLFDEWALPRMDCEEARIYELVESTIKKNTQT